MNVNMVLVSEVQNVFYYYLMQIKILYLLCLAINSNCFIVVLQGWWVKR